MRALTIFFVSTALLAQAPAPQAPAPAAAATQDSSEIPAAKSIGTMSEFMLEVVYPTSNELFYVGREEQKTEKDWIELRRNMLMMAESANLLMSPVRARDKDRWMRDAKLFWDVEIGRAHV